MSQVTQQHAALPEDAAQEYGSLSMRALLERIVRQSDRAALNELHANRTPCSLGPKKRLRCVEYLDALRERELRRKKVPARYDEALAAAYDMTLDKFYNLPTKSDNVKQKGPDCRLRYGAVVSLLSTMRAQWGHRMPQVEEERIAAGLLQGLVREHFYLSIREALRRVDPLRTRYVWAVNGATLCLWMPTRMVGAEKRRWLEQNVERPDPRRPGERGRVQGLIDRRLGFAETLPFDDDMHSSTEPEIREAALAIPAEGLAEAVATEKVNTLGRQRARIRELGSRALRRMVRRIFGALEAGQYSDSQVADMFGVKKSTFSRFAGSRWRRSKNGATAIPDLWHNTARVLAHFPPFTEALLSTGIWERVEEVLNTCLSHGEGRSQ